MNEKLPQRYGTQGLIENGKWVLYDTQDFPNLDQRRLEMGLSTYQDYKDQLASMYKLQG